MAVCGQLLLRLAEEHHKALSQKVYRGADKSLV